MDTGQVASQDTAGAPEGQDWRTAGEAWGSRANDWSCLYEHYSVDVLVALFARLGVGPGTSLLDIACGSGLAVRLAEAAGATVAGIDAAEDLIEVARERTPGADLRVGSMYELPWPDGSLDAALSINGIWGGCEEALDEAYRVLRPGGLIGMSFWGTGPPLDIRTFFRIFAIHAPKEHRGSMKHLNDISTPGVAEEMLTASGFSVLERGGRVSVVEWPDPEIAWRAISSVGPAVPALRTNDPAMLKREVLEALESCRDRHGVYRSKSDQQFVVARKP
jgi:SAM-dependent methyltransferase